MALVIKKTGIEGNVNFVKVSRLGKKPNDASYRPRAIKVVVSNTTERKRILEHTRNLKRAGDTFSKIYVKKDIHPLVRKELNQIHAVHVEREEQNKPENQGRNVEYNNNTHCVTVDGVIVDRFKPSFF